MNYRVINIITIIVTFILSSSLLSANDFKSSVVYKNEAEAVQKGKKLGIGSIELEGPERVTVYTYNTWTLIYTAGKAGIKPGGGIRVGMRRNDRNRA